MTRWLLPHAIAGGGEDIWLVDWNRPAAAVVDRPGRSRLAVWAPPTTAEPEADDDSPGRMVGDGVGLVVQYRTSIVWIGPDGTSRAVPNVQGLRLAAAEPERVWLVDGRYPSPPDDPLTGDIESPTPLTGLIVTLSWDGTQQEIRAPRPVHGLEFAADGEDVTVTFAEPVRTGPRDAFGGYSIIRAASRLRLPRHKLFVAGFEAEPEVLPVLERDDFVHYHEPGADPDSRWTWITSDPQLVLPFGERVGELVWWLGADPHGDRIHRHVLLRGHNPSDARLIASIDAGPGTVRTAARVRDELWFTVHRAPFAVRGHDQGIEVLALTPDGTLRTVLAPNAYDISFTDPPLLPRPTDEQIAAHVTTQRRRFEDLEDFWRDQNGQTHPLSDGLTNAQVALEGEWPDLALVIQLRHDSRPGLVLRRVLHLYDNRGRAQDLSNQDIELMEDLDTGYLPDAGDAIDGILEI